MTNMSISFIIPSMNRVSLHRTISSIEVRSGDEVLVEFDLPPSKRWGNDQRNKAMARATCDYIAFIDDDDMYVEGHREIMERAITENPGKPNLFRMQYPNGDVLWKEKEIVPGNLGSPMILVPNNKQMLYHWPGGRNMADFLFIEGWGWKDDDIIWRSEVIALLGNNDGAAKHHE